MTFNMRLFHIKMSYMCNNLLFRCILPDLMISSNTYALIYNHIGGALSHVFSSSTYVCIHCIFLCMNTCISHTNIMILMHVHCKFLRCTYYKCIFICFCYVYISYTCTTYVQIYKNGVILFEVFGNRDLFIRLIMKWFTR